nr:DNA helicase [Tanacetum cinerariifolium]
MRLGNSNATGKILSFVHVYYWLLVYLVSFSCLLLFVVTPDGHEVHGGSVPGDTFAFQESNDMRELPCANVQTVNIGGNVSSHLSTETHDVLDTTMGLFPRGDRQPTEDREIQTTVVGNAGVGGHVGSPSTIAPVNHAYLCLNVLTALLELKSYLFQTADQKMRFRVMNDERIQILLVVCPDTMKCLLQKNVQILGLKGQSSQVIYKLQHLTCLLPVDIHRGDRRFMFPLLFIFGELGFYPELVLKPRGGRGKGKKVTMNAYYKYQLHPRVKGFGLIFRGGRLFQQYFGAAFSAIKQSHLDFIRKRQNDLRSDYLLEFQKRGLPHCHTLLWVYSSSKIQDAAHIDEYISAALPDLVEDHKGYRVVSKLMMHGPCGVANPNAACTEKRISNKRFPKMYNDKTFFDTNGHTYYRRR